ncbi:MAG TPA: pyrroline-5-carboxylate reductase [Pseudolabrys sp.]|jgi:pyrroline-5-carboxylate reductase|nr:pyrroline-5-carboxylate reductase [Pseudolabrys sp.]
MAIRNVKRLGEFRGTLVLVGAGKMGSAMLDGWLARGLDPKKIIVIEPQPVKAVKALARRGVKLNPKDKVGVASAIVIAVKPQNAPEAVPPLARYVDKTTLVLSIMAGRTIGFLEKSLPTGTAIVRAMPNTPAAIGRGISVAVANPKISMRQRKQASDLLAAIGKVEWVDDEALMDAVTALSGSGPAYIFLLAECMARAGVAAGLPKELATRLARETVAGSAELLHRSNLDAATLRQNVTSPGGTTAAALEVLMGPGGFDQLLTQAIAAATRRSRDLAG